VAKKSTPVRPQKARKIASHPHWWPQEYEDVNWVWALEAIRHGNGPILARYLREVDEIDPRVRRGLAEILSPNSNHVWRLDARYRFRGTPTKLAKSFKPIFIAARVRLARLLSETNPIDDIYYRKIGEMLDPESRHPVRLDFKQRNSGRPPLRPPGINELHLVPAPIENDPATRVVRRALERIGEANKSGRKVPVKQLHDGISRATFFRRLKALSQKRNKTARPNAGSTK
jgi:hypothetical protein